MKTLDYMILISSMLLVTCQAAMIGLSKKSLRVTAPPVEPSLVQPISFTQQLLICNAYPGGAPVTVTQNGAEAREDQRNIRFNECRCTASLVRWKDKLDFVFADSGIRGTFEIGELPDSEALLLLVVEKRDATSPLVSFQSYAFPAHADGKNAQLAVIDTYKGKSTLPHLRMEDHIDNTEKKLVHRRIEQLNFNRIYAIEEGSYDASISDHVQDETGLEKKTFRLAKKQNYVILRTSDGLQHQSLVVYPELPRSASRPLCASIIVAFSAIVAVFLL
jgi:hypothetical protein